MGMEITGQLIENFKGDIKNHSSVQNGGQCTINMMGFEPRKTERHETAWDKVG